MELFGTIYLNDRCTVVLRETSKHSICISGNYKQTTSALYPYECSEILTESSKVITRISSSATAEGEW
jgi:hypothetical protein